jgi:uncharacterized protein YggU (UPF0235/DUF167 family)
LRPEPRPWKAVAGGLVVSVRATPKSARDGIEGVARLADGSVVLKLRVRAAPSDGEANEALSRLLARAAGVSPSAASLVRGGGGRIKSFRLIGDPIRLVAALEAALREANEGTATK